MPEGWRLALGVGLVMASVGLLVLQLRSVARLSPEQRVAARPKLGRLAFVLPHTAAEQRWFLAISVTAGVCEELLVMAAIVLSTGSLLPAMIVHVLTDIGGGTVGYWLLRDMPSVSPVTLVGQSGALL